jgi:hypothetical protein
MAKIVTTSETPAIQNEVICRNLLQIPILNHASSMQQNPETYSNCLLNTTSDSPYT